MTADDSTPRKRAHRSLMACRRCRRLKKRCTKDEGSERCQRCPEHGDCIFVPVDDDHEPLGHVGSSSSATSLFLADEPSQVGVVPPQIGQNQGYSCPYVIAVWAEFAAASAPATYAPSNSYEDAQVAGPSRFPASYDNRIVYSPPPYPPPGLSMDTPVLHAPTLAVNDTDINDPPQAPSFRRSHFSASPSPHWPDRPVPSYGPPDLSLLIPPDGARSSSGSSNPGSPHESYASTSHSPDHSVNGLCQCGVSSAPCYAHSSL